MRLQRLLLVGPWALGACTPTATEPPPAPPASGAPTVAQASAPRDRDEDGVVDERDRCPEVRSATPDGCPVPDSDRDGLLDPDDKCPDDAGPEPDGCPIPDTDGDGILDPQDACINTLETKNGYEDENGCPDEIPAELARMTGTIRGIYFELDRHILRPTSAPALQRAIRVLQKYPQIRIEISGHTDSMGGATYCKDLSGHRASEVKNYLVAHGIDAARIETRGAGPDEPVDTNKTARGRAKNRRIEFTILVQ